MPRISKNNQNIELIPTNPEQGFIPIGNTFVINDGDTKLLLRRATWSISGHNYQIQSYGPALPSLGNYFKENFSPSNWYLPATQVDYTEDDKAISSFYEQDISNLDISFVEFINKAIQNNQTGHDPAKVIRNIFAEACDSLIQFSQCLNPKFTPPLFQNGNQNNSNFNITLQNYCSFYVTKNRKVALLDAGIIIPSQIGAENISPKYFENITKNTNLFKNVFDENKSKDALKGIQLRPESFNFYHAIMLRGALNNLIENILKTKPNSAIASNLSQTKTLIENIIKQQTTNNLILQDFMKIFRGDFTPPTTIKPPPNLPNTGQAGSKPEPPKPPLTSKPEEPRNVFEKVKNTIKDWPSSAKWVCGILAMVTVCIMLYLVYAKITHTEEPTPDFYVVYPGENIPIDQIKSVLDESFNDKDSKPILINGGPLKRQQLLEDRLKNSLGKISKPEEITSLLNEISKQANIRFLGFESEQSDPQLCLKNFLEQNSFGDFSSIDSKLNDTGNLLQSAAKDRLLGYLKGKSIPNAGKLLDDLKQISTDQTSYKELLETIGDRTAIVIDGKKHPNARSKLLSRISSPEFNALPYIAKFATVGKKTEGSEGIRGTFSLVVPQKCHWRQIGVSDRTGIQDIENEYLANTNWREINPPTKIQWVPISVYKDGQSKDMSSFDLAIPIESNGKVVIFRNQTIYLRTSRESVQNTIKKYLKEKMQMTEEKSKDFFNINQTDRGFAGTILYTKLAQSFADGTPNNEVLSTDVEIMNIADLKQKMESENSSSIKKEKELDQEKPDNSKDGK